MSDNNRKCYWPIHQYDLNNEIFFITVHFYESIMLILLLGPTFTLGSDKSLMLLVVCHLWV